MIHRVAASNFNNDRDIVPGVNQWAYLRSEFTKLTSSWRASRLDELLPAVPHAGPVARANARKGPPLPRPALDAFA